MRNITLENITQAVIEHGDGGKTNPRLYECYTSLVKHLHAFVREVKLTEPELELVRDFLTQIGRPREGEPEGEALMFTDILGLSELVVLLNDEGRGPATEANNEGPLYVPDAPERKMGDRLGEDADGEPLLLSGRVLDPTNEPIGKAEIDVWQPNSQGNYDIQDPKQPRGNFRGRFRTDSDGRYEFETVVPAGYKVPGDGPCGQALKALGRHPWRPAHIHFKLGAKGYTPITTMTYIEGAPYIDSDTTFSVKASVIRPDKHASREALKARGRDRPFATAELDFVLRPASE
jgi:hydroxyquinol 1,2-dioxygenase